MAPGEAVRLDRNESPFGTSRAVLDAWEAQRTADARWYGLNRYGDFFQIDILAGLARHYGLTPANYTPVAGTSEAANVLAAALLRGGDLVRSQPIEDPISRPAHHWGATAVGVPLDAHDRQDLDAIALAVGSATRLVHLQNPHDPSGTSFGHDDLERLLAAVAARNPNTYVWIDESYAPYSARADFPRSFEIIARDPANSRLVVSRSFSTAHGIAGAPVAFVAASQTLTQQTEGITTGFVVPGAYGWANPDAGVNRMSEKALLALLAPDGGEFVRGVRARNLRGRARLSAILGHFGFGVVRSDASFVLARAPEPYRDGGLADALAAKGVLVRGPKGWGQSYAGHVRISVGSERELARLQEALGEILAAAGQKTSQPMSTATARTGTQVGASAGLGTLFETSGTGSRRALIGAGALVAAGLATPRALERAAEAWAGFGAAAGTRLREHARTRMDRREFFRRAGLGGAGLVAVLAALGGARRADAFPPDEVYDTFNLARMIWHENPVGPSPAALEAVREVIARGPGAAARYEEQDRADLVRAILDYNGVADRLGPENVMLLLGSAEGLTLTADALVAGGTLVSEWPAYRIIRERVWQAGGTVIDVAPDPTTWRTNYAAMKQALDAHPETGLIHFNAQNNPVGTVVRKAEFDEFAEWVFTNHRDTVILMDESDREFMDPGHDQMPDFLDYVAAGKNLIHLQTMSHIFALTGLRIGYLMAPPALVERLRPKRIDRPTSAFSYAAALASLDDAPGQIGRSYDVVAEGRRYLYGELDRMGLRYLPSQGAYVFLDTGRSGTAVWALLIAQGVLTRYGREWGMESWLRVCPGLPDENKRFIASLRTAMGQPDPYNLPTPPLPARPLHLERLLPPTPEGRSLAAELERGLLRDLATEAHTGPFDGPYRVTAGRAPRAR